jgi:AcrR family transcriptional regulator
MCSARLDDRTARARIRDAAIEHFAAHGFAKATIRGIAESANVSSGLLRHHFGSKDALREACDAYVLGEYRAYNERTLTEADLTFAAGARRELLPFMGYVTRSLVDGSPAARELFDELVAMTHRWLLRADADRDDQPEVDRHVRAAVITAMGLGVGILSGQLGRSMGLDPTSAQGDSQIARALLDAFSHPILSKEAAASAAKGFANQ